MTFHWAQVIILLADFRLVKLLNTVSMSPVIVTFKSLNAFLKIHSADNAFLIRFLYYSMYGLKVLTVDSGKGIQLL